METTFKAQTSIQNALHFMNLFRSCYSPLMTYRYPRVVLFIFYVGKLEYMRRFNERLNKNVETAEFVIAS